MRPLNLEIKGGYAFGSAKFEWRGVAAPERDPQPARGEEWVLPPQPHRTLRTPATRFTSGKSRLRSGGANCKKAGKSCNASAQRRTRRIPSAKSSGSAKCKRVGKPCSASTPRRTRRTAAPRVAAHRFRATFEGRDNITGRFMAPLKTPSRYVPPRRAMRRLGASALLQALPRAQSLALRRRKF
jgi:hypothetical protein